MIEAIQFDAYLLIQLEFSLNIITLNKAQKVNMYREIFDKINKFPKKFLLQENYLLT